MSEKQAYRKKIQAKMEAWNAEIEKLEARAESAGADFQIEYYEKIKRLRALQAEVTSNLEELDDASDDAWEDLKNGVDVAASAVEHAVDVAAKRLS